MKVSPTELDTNYLLQFCIAKNIMVSNERELPISEPQCSQVAWPNRLLQKWTLTYIKTSSWIAVRWLSWMHYSCEVFIKYSRRSTVVIAFRTKGLPRRVEQACKGVIVQTHSLALAYYSYIDLKLFPFTKNISSLKKSHYSHSRNNNDKFVSVSTIATLFIHLLYNLWGYFSSFILCWHQMATFQYNNCVNLFLHGPAMHELVRCTSPTCRDVSKFMHQSLNRGITLILRWKT
jgi:hypothetical protein